MLQVKVTGASSDGDPRQSLRRHVKLDSGSPENLISSSLLEDLDAELIKDRDYLVGANNTSLNVVGAAMVWLTWGSESGERKELIYFLVVQVLSHELLVSEGRDATLFEELRHAEGPWESSRGRSVLTIELDKMTVEEREEADRRRDAMVARAREIQARKDRDRADARNRPDRQQPQGRT